MKTRRAKDKDKRGHCDKEERLARRSRFFEEGGLFNANNSQGRRILVILVATQEEFESQKKILS